MFCNKGVLVLSLISVMLMMANVSSGKDAAFRRRVMPWMCLERCGDDQTAILQQLVQFKSQKSLITGVSFELYNLGENGVLITNNLTEVGRQLIAMGFETYPMISSYPYPPAFLDWMRYVFKNPQPFIDNSVAELVKRGFTGFNVDWEPTATATAQDGKDYAAFLNLFGEALHKQQKKLSVDVSGWSPIWDWEAISQTSIDKIMLMSTYNGKYDVFKKSLERAVSEIDMNKLGIGLETVNDANHSMPFTHDELQQRFDLIQQYKIQEIDLWRAPIPADWIPFIEKFVHGK